MPDITSNINKIIIFWVCFVLAGWIAGGLVFINGIRLYDTWIISNWLRYDQLTHFLNSFFLFVIVWSLFQKNIKASDLLRFVILGLAIMGVSALYEVIELGMVVFIDANKGVGDYMNNALDLFFDFLGVVSAIGLVKTRLIKIN